MIRISNDEKRDHSTPFITASLSVGQISLFACKDSFSLLMGVIRDISTEWTAISYEAKKKTFATDPIESQQYSADSGKERPETSGDVLSSCA